jgi:hypothetical protein
MPWSGDEASNGISGVWCFVYNLLYIVGLIWGGDPSRCLKLDALAPVEGAEECGRMEMAGPSVVCSPLIGLSYQGFDSFSFSAARRLHIVHSCG